MKPFESMSGTLRNTWRSLRLIRALTFFLGIASVAAAAEDIATGLAPGAMAASADGGSSSPAPPQTGSWFWTPGAPW